MVRAKGRRERRREARLVRGLALSRVRDAVCATYEVERSELRRRGGRHPARAALAYVARRTAATNAELMAVLGLSRPESVPNLTRRFESWLASDRGTRRLYRRSEEG